MKKKWSLFLSLFFIIFSGFLLRQGLTGISESNLESKIQLDLVKLENQKFFPEGFKSLSNIRVSVHTSKPEMKSQILKSIVIPFEQKPLGKHSLQIDAIENFSPPREALLILQLSLFENSTQNKIWEASRIYHLDNNDLKSFQLSN
jgi:hypothetical protein